MKTRSAARLSEEKLRNLEHRRGAEIRKSYDNEFRLRVLQQVACGKSLKNVAVSHKVHISLVSKWCSSWNEFIENTFLNPRKWLKERRRSRGRIGLIFVKFFL